MGTTESGTGQDDSNKKFEDLAPKQKKIVDARAKHPEWTNQQVVGEVDSNKGYVSRVLNDYEEIVEQRREEVMREQYEPDVGDIDNGETVDDTSTTGEQAADAGSEDGITVHFPTEMVRESLRRRELSEEVYEHFVDEVMDRAFGPGLQDPDDQ